MLWRALRDHGFLMSIGAMGCLIAAGISACAPSAYEQASVSYNQQVATTQQVHARAEAILGDCGLGDLNADPVRVPYGSRAETGFDCVERKFAADPAISTFEDYDLLRLDIAYLRALSQRLTIGQITQAQADQDLGLFGQRMKNEMQYRWQQRQQNVENAYALDQQRYAAMMQGLATWSQQTGAALLQPTYSPSPTPITCSAYTMGSNTTMTCY